MRLVSPRLATPLVLALLASAPALADHDHHHAADEALGKIHFPISCQPAQQAAFDRGVALLHSFGYERAEAAFDAVAAADPACGMALWGVAMSNYHQIWGPPTDAEFARGQAAAKRAVEVGARSARDRDWIAAAAAFYVEPQPRPHVERVAAYERAMAELAARYPDDDEAQIFRALALLSLAYNSPPDKTYARQKQAAEILNRLLPREPEHPGVAHYMIHSFDYPELATLALPAARAYARIAPASPHAQHMPSHIFTRLGLWRDSIASNLASEETARRLTATAHPGATSFDGLHAMDYLEYAYLQTARDDAARGVVERTLAVTSLDQPTFSAGFALAAVPARYALERRDWRSAADLVTSTVFPWEKFPPAEAIVRFARSVGAARSGDLAAARRELERLAAIESALRGQKGFDWATQVEIERRAASAWIARAEKRDDEALASLRTAADLEDSTDKHPVTPGAVLPAREQLADLLAELGQSKAALAEYERSLASAPARYNSLVGAAQAADQIAEAARAADYYRRLAELCQGSTGERARRAADRAREREATAARGGSPKAP
ncbi:MAG: hypothetical protein U0X73_14510 [Thermoanaerobaculia bacterium]